VVWLPKLGAATTATLAKNVNVKSNMADKRHWKGKKPGSVEKTSRIILISNELTVS